MDFFAVSFVVGIDDVEMHSFCLLASMELIPTSNCSLLYLHSNDCYTNPQLKLVCNQLKVCFL